MAHAYSQLDRGPHEDDPLYVGFVTPMEAAGIAGLSYLALPTGALTWLALLAGIGASLAANVAAAEPTLVGRFVAAWPPLAFAVAFEMAMRTRTIHHRPQRASDRTSRR